MRRMISKLSVFLTPLCLQVIKWTCLPCLLKLPIHEPNVNGGESTKSRQRSKSLLLTPVSSRTTPMIITYALSPTNTIEYIDLPLIKAVVNRAFECYTHVIPVFFLRVMDYLEADVKIGFYSGDHDGCSHPFVADKRVLAHALPNYGKIHINMKYRWSVDFRKERSSMAMDLESVMLHEIGHVLGLEHSSKKEAVMFEKLRRRTTKAKLTAEDIKMVQTIYCNDLSKINNDDWKVITVDACFDGRLAGGGFILWSGKRQLKFAQSFPLNCFSSDAAAFEACCIGLNFLKMHNIDQVLVLTNYIDVVPILRFTAKPSELSKWLCGKEFTIKFENRYREGLKATAQLAKMGRGSKLVRRMELINWPEQMLGLLNCEARMLRHLPLDSFS